MLIRIVGNLGKEKILVYLEKVEILGGIFNFSVPILSPPAPDSAPDFFSRAPDFFPHDRLHFGGS